MNEQTKKSYNPFKMLGSWVGFVLGILSYYSYVANHVVFLHPFAWMYFSGVQMDWEGVGILAVLTLPIVFFVYGWIIHSVLRKIGWENSALVLILVSMLVVLPVTYGLVKDKQTFRDSLNSADSDILAAKALPGGAPRTSDSFQRESVAMNAIMVLAKSEKDISLFTAKMVAVAQNESIAIDVRLTALEALSSKVGEMSGDQKKMLSDQMVTFEDTFVTSSKLDDVGKERMAGRVTALKKLLAQ